MLSTGWSSDTLEKILQINPSVKKALEAGEPIVALESTIVAHGMPFPENFQLATEVETILRDKVSRPLQQSLLIFSSRDSTTGADSSRITYGFLGYNASNHCDQRWDMPNWSGARRTE